jgi:hypothetical protein
VIFCGFGAAWPAGASVATSAVAASAIAASERRMGRRGTTVLSNEGVGAAPAYMPPNASLAAH